METGGDGSDGGDAVGDAWRASICRCRPSIVTLKSAFSLASESTLVRRAPSSEEGGLPRSLS